MTNNKKILDTSSELVIFRWGNGIKLYPILTEKNPNKLIGLSTGQHVGDMLKLPIDIFFVDTESKTQNMNDICVANMGLVSTKEARGKTILDVSPKENAMEIISGDQAVMLHKKPKIIEDLIIRNDGKELHFLTCKIPWYNIDNQIIGVFGYSILLGEHPLASSLSQIMQLGLLQPESLSPKILSGREINGVYLTQKEVELLYQIIRGKTAKTIAKMYHVSFRTIEERMHRVKHKFNVSSKSELIDCVIDSFI